MASGSAHFRLKQWFHRTGWRSTIIATPYVWLLAFFFLPFLIVLVMSLATQADVSPPFAFGTEWPYVTFDNIARLFEDSLYIRAYLISISNAAITTVICLIIGYPMALCLTRVGKHGAIFFSCWSSFHFGRRFSCASMRGSA